MSEANTPVMGKEEAKSFAEFGTEIFKAALESMRDQLSPEELEAMKAEGEATIAQFKKENNIE